MTLTMTIQAHMPTFGTFIVDPQANGAAYTAIRTAAQACAQGQPTSPLLLLGAPASGKSHLLSAVAAQLAPLLGHRLHVYGGAAFVALCHAAHTVGDPRTARRLALAGEDLLALRRRWARARAVLLDDLGRLADQPAAQRELCALLAAASLSGALVLLAGRTAPETRGSWTWISAWAYPTALALTPCRRLDVRPIAAGRPPATRVQAIRAALARRGLTLAEATLEQVAGLPLPLDVLAERVQDIWRQPSLGETRRLAQLRQAHRAYVRDHVQAGRPTPDAVLTATAAECRTTVAALRGRARTASVVRARQIAMYLLCTETGLSSSAAGLLLGRDHATVLHGRDTIARLIATQPPAAVLVAAVRTHLTGHQARAAARPAHTA